MDMKIESIKDKLLDILEEHIEELTYYEMEVKLLEIILNYEIEKTR